MKNKRKSFHVPIHDVEVVVVVTNDIPKAYKKEFKIEIDDTQGACLGYCGRKFGLFIDNMYLRKGIIAHEIFHLTHRILEKNTMNFDCGHHEMGAYLCEYLTDKIYGFLNVK